MKLARNSSQVALKCNRAREDSYANSQGSNTYELNFTKQFRSLKLFMFLLFVTSSLTIDAQNCSHPAVTAGLATVPSSNVNFAAQTGFIDFNNNGVQEANDGDGSYLYVNNGCGSAYNFNVQSGAFYGFIKERGINYTAEICYSSTTFPKPQFDVWATRASGSAIVASSTEIVLNATTNCARVTLNDCMQNVFLAVYSHNCLDDWRPWTMNVTCTPCTLTCPSSIVNLSTQGSDCDVDVASLPLPTYCSALTWNYTVTNTATAAVVASSSATGSTFNVNDLPLGMYSVALSAPNPCAAATPNPLVCNYTVVVRPPLFCNDQINIGLPDNCSINITPDAVLEDICTDTNVDFIGYEIDVNNTGSSMIVGGQAGDIYSYVARIFQDLNNDGIRNTGETVYNSCTGQIALQDFVAPRVTCTNATVLCGASTDISAIANPTAVDNCSGIDATRTSYVDSNVAGDGCTDLDGDGYGIMNTINRTWTYYDNSGNSSSCTQVITVRRPLLNNLAATATRPRVTVLFPSNRSDVAGLATSITGVGVNANGTADDAINCSAITYNSSGPIVPTSLTGEPSIWIDNLPASVTPGAEDLLLPITVSCMYGSAPVDQVLDACGTTKEIVRVWTVMDWCNSNNVQVYSNVANPQVIKIADVTAPTIGAVSTSSIIVTPNSNYSCGANITLPAVTVSDNCNTTTVRVSNPTLGTINTNGGVFTNVAAGTYTFTYTATDACNNSSTRTVNVTVQDNLEPIAVCEQSFVVSLTSAGTAIAYAQTFDDGSFDNCAAALTFIVRRNDNGSAFGPFVSFDCNDIGDIIPVTLQVSDGTRTNQCTVNVTVQDPYVPQFTYVPANITVNVGTNLTNTANTNGIATATDNCTNLTMTYADEGTLDNCGEGVITRRWTSSDGSNFLVRTQTITVTNLNPFTALNITFPADVTVSCGSTASTGTPLINGGIAGMIAVGYDDDTLTVIGSDICKKILRQWTVIDWCQYDASNPTQGRYTHEQVIKISDNVGPVFTSFPDDRIINASVSSCTGTVQLLGATATDACGDNVTISVIVPTAFTGNGTGFGPYTNIPIGTYTVTYVATDGCGNATTRNTTVTIRDNEPPVVVCLPFLSMALPSTDILAVDATTFIIASATSDACSNPLTITGRVINTLDPASNANVPYLPRINFTCESASCGIVTVEVRVCDNAGNCAFCTIPVQILDNDGSCAGVPCITAPRPAGLVQGVVQNEVGATLAGAVIHMMHDAEAMPSLTTSNEGTFEFSGLEIGENYMIEPEKNNDPLNGVTTLDLVLISKHILGLQEITSPYKIIAADINNSGSITTLDMVELRKLILNMIPNYSNNTAWRFVRSDYSFSNQNVLGSQFPELFEVYPFNQDLVDVNFVAIKIGDVNGSAVFNTVQASAENRNERKNITFTIQDQDVKANTQVKIPVTATDFKNITGFQHTMSFNPSALTFREVIPGRIADYTDLNIGNNKTAEGFLTTSWNNATPQTFNSNDVLFTLVFESKEEGTLSEMLSINGSITPAEAYIENDKNDTEIIDIALAFRNNANELVSTDGMELLNNNPNPFKEETRISFWLPSNNNARLVIYDLTGKMIKSYGNFNTKGYHEIKIVKHELGNVTGVFYYQLETETQTLTKKMIAID